MFYTGPMQFMALLMNSMIKSFIRLLQLNISTDTSV